MWQIEIDRLQIVLRGAADSQCGLTGFDDAGYLLMREEKLTDESSIPRFAACTFFDLRSHSVR